MLIQLLSDHCYTTILTTSICSGSLTTNLMLIGFLMIHGCWENLVKKITLKLVFFRFVIFMSVDCQKIRFMAK